VVSSGLLDPDPWKRWTAYQASQHPFITGLSGQLRKKTAETKLDMKEENQANRHFDVYWVPPWDPGICRRKLLSVQKMREKQNAQRRGFSQPRHKLDNTDDINPSPMRSSSRGKQQSPSMNSINSRGQLMMVADSPSVGHMSVDGKSSPPSQIASQVALQRARNALQNRGLGTASMPKQGLGIATSSSLSEIGPSGLQAALAMEDPNRKEQIVSLRAGSNPQYLSGPQSFTGIGYEKMHRNPADGDFAYALQRPGNVPGMGSDAATVASQQSAMSSSTSGVQPSSQHQLQQQQPQQQYGRGVQQNSLPMHSPMDRRMYAGANPPSSSSVSSLPNSSGYQMSGGMMGGLSYQGYGNSLSSLNSGSFDQPGGLQYLSAQQQQQRGGGDELHHDQQIPAHLMTEYHHQLLLQEQQKQLAALHEQHQRQLQALQQQQALAFQQQQQQYLNQYGGTTGNGYYYVTSADGTPMLMQSGGGPMGTQGSYDGGAGYMMPPQQQRSFDENGGGGGTSRSVRDRPRHQTSRHGGRAHNGDNFRGGTGMSM
jgi:hypothetical protein